jgi:hypothetical protein
MRILLDECVPLHRPTLERHFFEIHTAVGRIKAGEYLAMEAP